MSKVAIQGNASGTGVFTLASPATNTDRTLTLPDEAGTVLTDRAIGVNASAPDDSLVVDASGNVGIGTSSPVARIHGEVAAATNSNVELLRLTDSVYCDFKVLLDRQTTVGTSISRVNTAAGIMAFESGNTERMRIDSSGNLLVGTTTTPFSGGIGVLITGTAGANYWQSRANTTAIYGHLSFYNPNGNTGEIRTTGSSTAYITSSDYRMKHDIAPMTGALARVAALKPCTYKWNADDSDGEGFIAHELQEVCPSAVSGEKDAVNGDGSIKPQGIDTSFLVATLTAAIQELKAINDAQAQTIESLTARVVALEGQP